MSTIVLLVCLQKVYYNKGTEIILNYGDSFLDVPLLDWEQKNVDWEDKNQDYTFVYYLDKGCGTCVDSLTTINNICNVYKEMNVANMIVWEGKTGENYAQKNGIPIEYNYTIKDAHIGTSTPTFYILDKNMDIIFKGEMLDDMIKKISLLEISDVETINENYIKTLADTKDTRPLLVYFSMVGCPDCELVNPIIEGTGIQDAFQVLTFYRDRENVPVEKMTQVDAGDLLAYIYGVDWYPSFLILHNSGKYEIIGETDPQEIEEKLLNCVY